MRLASFITDITTAEASFSGTVGQNFRNFAANLEHLGLTLGLNNNKKTLVGFLKRCTDSGESDL